MSLKETIAAELKQSLMEKNEVKTGTLRLLIAAVRNKEIETRKKDVGLADDEIITVIRQEVKKRRDAIEGFRNGGREDLVAGEVKELLILETYLPPELSEEEVQRIVSGSIQAVHATSIADFGKVMKHAMGALSGRTSGDKIAGLVREQLAHL